MDGYTLQSAYSNTRMIVIDSRKRGGGCSYEHNESIESAEGIFEEPEYLLDI